MTTRACFLLLTLSCLVACSSSGGADAGGCSQLTGPCVFTTDCCLGLRCQAGLCAPLQSGNNNGATGTTSAVTGSSSNGSGTSGIGSGTSGIGSGTSGIGSGTSGSPSGTSGAGTPGTSNSSGTGTSTGTSGASAGTTGSVIYCDGLDLQDSTGDQVYLQSYDFDGQLAADGCYAQVSTAAPGVSFTALGGIWDLDSDDLGGGSNVYADVLFAAGCDDLGLSSAAIVGGAPPPTTNVATSVAAQGTGVSVTGIVTAIQKWYPVDAMYPTAKAGRIYVEDYVAPGGTPSPNSGIYLFVPATVVATFGTTYPARGDAITVTGLNWAVFRSRNEFTATATSVLADLGSVGLPPAVQLLAADLLPQGGSANSAPYRAMRVQVSDTGPFTVAGACPADLMSQ